MTTRPTAGILLILSIMAVMATVMGWAAHVAHAQDAPWRLELEEPAPNIQHYTLTNPVLRYPARDPIRIPSEGMTYEELLALTQRFDALGESKLPEVWVLGQEGPYTPDRPIQPQRWGEMSLESEINYEHEGTALRGVLVEPTGQAKGTVLVVHAWKGLGDEEKERARMLAKLGYRAFALDMYGAGVYAKDTEEAAKRAGEFYGNRQLMRGRVRAAMDALKDKNKLGDKVAAIGYCFGGTVVLECARSGFDFDAVVSFHGGLKFESAPRRGQVKASVLVCNGYDDPYVPVEERQAFKREMAQAGADFVFIDYSGAVHSFTSKAAGPPAEGKGAAYDQKADERSWEAMQDWFEAALG